MQFAVTDSSTRVNGERDDHDRVGEVTERPYLCGPCGEGPTVGGSVKDTVESDHF